MTATLNNGIGQWRMKNGLLQSNQLFCLKTAGMTNGNIKIAPYNHLGK
jgi:hypothetical protein